MSRNIHWTTTNARSVSKKWHCPPRHRYLRQRQCQLHHPRFLQLFAIIRFISIVWLGGKTHRALCADTTIPVSTKLYPDAMFVRRLSGITSVLFVESCHVQMDHLHQYRDPWRRRVRSRHHRLIRFHLREDMPCCITRKRFMRMP